MECSIRINNHSYSLTDFVQQSLGNDQHWAIPAQVFLKAWLAGDTTFPIQTSGSTGTPKVIHLSKTQMIVSAQATIETIKIPNGTNALLCINAAYVGGQMMLVRAMIGHWHLELVAPTMDPSSETSRGEYGFSGLVPLQVRAMLSSSKGKALLDNIQNIIIGGAPVSEDLIEKIQKVKSQCFHTYGMTETVSHIGLKALNGPNKSDWFEIVKGNEIDLDHRGCLKVKGAVTEGQWIITNDLVEIKGTQFKWLSRADLVANSGGVKILLEKAEQQLNALLPEQIQGKLLLWKAPDKELGERLIGMTTDQELIIYIKTNESKLKDQLPAYYLPKVWLLTPQFTFTESGKLDRPNTYATLPTQPT